MTSLLLHRLTILEAEVSAGIAAKAAEVRKHSKYDNKFVLYAKYQWDTSRIRTRIFMRILEICANNTIANLCTVNDESIYRFLTEKTYPKGMEMRKVRYMW